MAIVGLFLFGRWIYLAARSPESGDTRAENAGKVSNVNFKRTGAAPLLTYAVFLILIGYVNKDNGVTFWITVVLAILFTAGSIVALIRSIR